MLDLESLTTKDLLRINSDIGSILASRERPKSSCTCNIVLPTTPHGEPRLTHLFTVEGQIVQREIAMERMPPTYKKMRAKFEAKNLDMVKVHRASGIVEPSVVFEGSVFLGHQFRRCTDGRAIEYFLLHDMIVPELADSFGEALRIAHIFREHRGPRKDAKAIQYVFDKKKALRD